jgi:hypothetical protein
MKPGDGGRASIGGKAKRPVIVLHVKGDRAVLIYGTSTPGHHYAHVMVNHRTIGGIKLKLENPTFYYAPSVTSLKLADIEARGVCLPNILHSIEEKLLEWMKDGSRPQPPRGLVSVNVDGDGIDYFPNEKPQADPSKP